MGRTDDNVAIIGDWVPPSPSPRTFFSAMQMLGEDISSRPTMDTTSNDHKTEKIFLRPREHTVSENAAARGGVPGANSGDRATEFGTLSEQKFRGGLVERIAARAGFNAPRLNTESIRSTDHSLNSEVKSPYLTIPPGLSPTTLLDSPVFLSNSLAQQSPTTGKFQFLGNVCSNRSSTIMSEANNKGNNNPFDDNSTSFAFRPSVESGSSFFLSAASKTASATILPQSCPRIEVPVPRSENSFQSHLVEPSLSLPQNQIGHHPQVGLSTSYVEKDDGGKTVLDDQGPFDSLCGGGGGGGEHSSPLNEQPDEGEQRGSGDSMAGGGCGAPSEDGYNWRKYGQKQVKGSEYPRSYYKCTHPNCQVKKKVERSHEGHITEIIYKGAHKHPKPSPNRRAAIGSSDSHINMQLDIQAQAGHQNAEVPLWEDSQKGIPGGAPDWMQENLEVTSSASLGPEYGNHLNPLQAQNNSHIETVEAIDASSTFSNDEDEDDRGTHGSITLGYEGEGDESESKKRKLDAYVTEMSGATRAIREPRVVVQTTSEVDILDDGYRWRKYGQKVVKGNPNPRSYYKCTNPGCTVRKHVERASHDLKSVITTYEGKHNHDVPAARNSSHISSGTSSPVTGQNTTAAMQTHVHRSGPPQTQNTIPRFERPAFGFSGRQQMGTAHGFAFGMNQPGLGNLNMAAVGQAKLPVMPMHPYLAQAHHVNEMGFLLPKGEPNVEPTSDLGLNFNGSTVYQQIMSRLPLGPEM
ncbi:probable WRKY transcription factor 2 isoform X2 [Benincasa hispida]|uniref:probable WRKY transcription factor 2 isoform X2 n=1 Tax=Benincasa hispida TaxID=102211 RepID=UPI0018FF3634|nr:probable WRKY transcription factor 2 isoform X2 [Benincasa hispida]